MSMLRLEGTAAAQANFEVFRRELDAHLEAEETWLLPPFELVKPHVADACRVQHAKVRSAAALAAQALASRTVDETPLYVLDQLLCQHCRDEEGDLYRWCETAIGEQASRAVLRKIEAVELEEW
jgi:hypothetical protein